MVDIKKNLGLTTHQKSKKYFVDAYKKKVKNAAKCKRMETKKRRMQLRQESEATRKSLGKTKEQRTSRILGLNLIF